MKLKDALKRMFNDKPVMVNLLERAGMSFSMPCSSLEEIETKLEEMRGKRPAETIIERLRQELA